jgi:flagellar hook-associated protein 2
VITKINSTTNAAYKATAVQVSPGKYTLQLTATATGEGTAFAAKQAAQAPGTVYFPAGVVLPETVPGVPAAATVTTNGADAELAIGTTTPLIVRSATNSFVDVLPGVTLTVTRKQTDTPVTVNVVADAEGVAAKVQALVDNVNTVLNDIASQTRGKSGNVAASPLAGDSAVRKLSQELLSAVSAGGGALGSFSAVGITLGREGKLSFSKAEFLTANAADPAKTQAYFDSYTNVDHAKAKSTDFDPGWDTGDGLARKLETIGLLATEGILRPTDPAGTAKEGTLPGLIKRKNEAITGLNDQVAAWDVRLANRQRNLQRQFSALEVAMSKMQSQSTWLSGQIAGLPN